EPCHRGKKGHIKKLLQWSFTKFVDKSVEKPQCVLCNKLLTAESMKPSKLKEHFERSHSQFLDESTDVASCSQLLVYIRYIFGDDLKEEYLFSESLSTTTRGEDIFRIVKNCVDEKRLQWSKLIGVCTDGAPAMLGIRSGFQTLMKEVAPFELFSHCIIHRYALAGRTLLPDLLDTFTQIVKIVNYIRNSATNTRVFKDLCNELGGKFDVLLLHTEVSWLSRGKVLHRVLELRTEIVMFLEKKKSGKVKKNEFHAKITDNVFIFKLAYLADFFGEINTLNLSLQGNMTNILTAQDKVASFLRKLQFYQRRAEVGDISMFSELTMVLDEKNEKCSFANQITLHLLSVVDSIDKYFPDLENRQVNTWVLRPFSVDESVFSDIEIEAKAQFLELREDNTQKIDFKNTQLATFWRKIGEYPLLSDKVLKILIPFSTTYRCESGFSTMVTMKTKSRNRLNLEHDIRCALAETEPNIKQIVRNKQY
ncbi:zinc finger BED domain-containing protein 5-like, partial [Melanaphis sacchari]|uniref:zinc finger BED domain-containing protein 5-like n=1 Tax=Melanaphis sacchari TaxID=742174 RepID=UPI000DC1362E